MGFKRYLKKINVVKVDFFKNLFTYRNVDLTYKKDKKNKIYCNKFCKTLPLGFVLDY